MDIRGNPKPIKPPRSTAGDKKARSANNEGDGGQQQQQQQQQQQLSRRPISAAVTSLDDLLDDLESWQVKKEQGPREEKREPKTVAAVAVGGDDVKAVKLTAVANSEDDDLVKLVDELTNKMVESFNSPDVEEKNTSTFGNCAECRLPVEGEATIVEGKHFHPRCFHCQQCKKPLGSGKYFVIDGKRYCENDKDAFLEKCAACGKGILGNLVRPKGGERPFHPACFTCHKCSKSIVEKYFVDGGGFICEDDYKASVEKCSACGSPILGRILHIQDSPFHPECFTCSKCSACLSGIQFYMVPVSASEIEKEKPLCRDCFAVHAAKCCSTCNQPILDDCQVNISTGGYYHRDCYKKS